MQVDLSLTESAEQRLKTLFAKHDNKKLFLRIVIDSGGCNGFQYQFDFDSKVKDDDISITKDGNIFAVIDEVSYDLIKGSQVDYVDELGGSFFKIVNPNASSTCGCGSSFSV